MVVFEILAVDTRGASVIKNEKNLFFSLLGNGPLWKNPELVDGKKIVDGTLTCELRSISADEDLKTIFSKAFLIRAKGAYSEIEPFRIPVVKYLKDQKFDFVYILTDQASEQIACKLYPLLYQVENLLRHYVIKFMVTRLGPSWWDVTATSELSQKVRNRKNNEPVFGDNVDNKAYLIDFGDLGKMIYAHSSGFMSKEDIVKKLLEVDETPEAIKKFKEQLQSNYQKFFKETFKDKGFQEKWEKLEKLRNKIAHNSLFNEQDLSEGQTIATELIALIKEADKSAEKVALEVEDKTAIKESLVAHGYAFEVITEEEFLKQLEEREVFYGSQYSDGFVALGLFVKGHLGTLGYDHTASFEVAERLDKQGVIEIYKVMKDEKDDHPVSAVRTINKRVAEAKSH